MANSHSMNLRISKGLIIIIVIFLLSFGIRLIFLNAGLWHHDSVELAMLVEKAVSTGKIDFGGYKSGVTLINALVFFPFFALGAKSSALAVTINTALFAALSAAILYLLVSSLFSRRLGVLSALIFSACPVFLVTTTYANSHPFSLFFALLSLYLLAIKKECRWLLSVSGLLLGLIFFLRPDDGLMVLPHLVLFFMLNKGDIFKKLLRTYLPTAIIGLIYLALSHSTLTGYIQYNALQIAFSSLAEPVYWLIFSLTPLGLVLAAYGAIGLEKKHILFFSAWFAPSFFYHSLTALFSARFLIPAIIPLCILAGRGLLRFWNSKALFFAGLIALLCLMVIPSLPLLSFRHGFSGGKELALQTEKLAGANSTLIVYGDDSIFFEYYTSLNTLACNQDPTIVFAQINTLISQNKAVYYSESCHKRLGSPGTAYFYGKLNENYNLTWIGKSLFEDYHKNDLYLANYSVELYKVTA